MTSRNQPVNNLSPTKALFLKRCRMSCLSLSAVFPLGSMVPVGGAMAHHSTAAYNYSQAVTMEGTVSAFFWTNPHMYIQIMVRDAAGKEVKWAIECGTPNINVRHGWKESDIKPGDNIKVKIHPLRRANAAGGTLMLVTLADGRMLYGPGNDILAAPPQ